MVDFKFEQEIWSKGIASVAGVDESGRGPLAGPVVAAAVVFPSMLEISGLDDSKKLSPKQRGEMFHRIYEHASSVGISVISHTIIDEINIYQASLRAMSEAVSKLSRIPEHLLIDGPRYRDSSIPFTAIIDGDAKSCSIAAASIVAKVTRDRLMIELDGVYPQYGFAKHKGYGTAQHLEAIRKYGPCEIHRKSFRMPAKLGE